MASNRLTTLLIALFALGASLSRAAFDSVEKEVNERLDSVRCEFQVRPLLGRWSVKGDWKRIEDKKKVEYVSPSFDAGVEIHLSFDAAKNAKIEKHSKRGKIIINYKPDTCELLIQRLPAKGSAGESL